MKRSIDPSLVKAYREAHYAVFAEPEEFVLRVEHASHALAQLMKRKQISTAAYLTASNPESQPGDASVWDEAQRSLLSDLDAMNLPYVGGEGRDPTGQWPSEASVLVLGITRNDSERLAYRYRQNAFLWIGSEAAIPSLILTLDT